MISSEAKGILLSKKSLILKKTIENNMKTIEIQKDKKIKDSIYVFVNGKKHFMQHQYQSLRIEVADDKPFEIRVKQTWDGSPIYTFNPKDDMVLLVSEKKRWQYILVTFYISLMIMAIVILYLTENMRFWHLPFLIIFTLYHATYYTKRRKKSLEIQEANIEN